MRGIETLVDVNFADEVLKHPGCVGNERQVGLLGPLDGEQWSNDLFEEFIFENLKYAASTPEEWASVISPEVKIRKIARRIRICEGKSKASELAEICLYGIMREHYHALPAVAKIYYKQNVNDTVKGADSVHVVLESDGKFSLWYGEAKFYQKITDAKIQIIVGSVKDMLDSNKMTKENELVLGVPALRSLIEDDIIYRRIESMLSHEGLSDELCSILHVPILLLYQDAQVLEQEPITKDARENIRANMEGIAKQYFDAQIKELGSHPQYSQICFHLILFPIPNKAIVAERFNRKMTTLRGMD